MSQPKVYGVHEQDPFAQPLISLPQLIDIFVQAEKKVSELKLGIEYEMFGNINDAQTPLPYESSTSITSLFKHLVRKTKESDDPFIPLFEENNIVALECKKAIIALEPGGQLEIAAKPHRTLTDVTQTFEAVVTIIKNGACDLSIHLFALGIHPSAQRNEMAVVKKARYGIMRDYMAHLNGLGLDMMTRSCAIQLNLDFVSEEDMVEKTRLAAALVPFYSLLCSSVAFVEKKPSHIPLFRSHVWRTTDPDRTGIPALIFAKDFGYESWINMVLQIPMYFIRRQNIYHNVAGASFLDFIKHGLLGEKPFVRDFIDHMSTVFTDVRLKPILELRSADSLPVPFVNALSALTWALFYDERAKNQAQVLFASLTHAELQTLHHNVIEQGKEATFRGEKIFHIIKKLLNMAENALNNNQFLLNPFHMLVEKNITCADWIREKYAHLDQTNLKSLVKDFDPLNNPLL